MRHGQRTDGTRGRSNAGRISALVAILALVSFFAGCHQKAPPPKPYAAFIACAGNNTVAVVDLSSLKTIASIPVAPQIIRVVARPHTHDIFAFSTDGTVSVIEFPSDKVVRRFSAGRSARNPWFSSDGKQLYVLDFVAGDIVTIDASRARVERKISLAPGLADLALTPDGKTLIASDPHGDRVFFVDAQSGKILGSAAVGKGPGPLVVLPDSSKVFVADTADDKISVLEVANRTLAANIEIGSAPERMDLKPDGGELFVFSASAMTILDTSQDDVEQSFPTGKDVAGTMFRNDSSMLYIATAANGFVTFFDVANREVTSAVQSSTSPGALALTPDGRFLVVLGTASGSLSILKTDPPGLLTNIPVGSDPDDVIVPGWLLR